MDSPRQLRLDAIGLGRTDGNMTKISLQEGRTCGFSAKYLYLSVSSSTDCFTFHHLSKYNGIPSTLQDDPMALCRDAHPTPNALLNPNMPKRTPSRRQRK